MYGVVRAAGTRGQKLQKSCVHRLLVPIHSRVVLLSDHSSFPADSDFQIQQLLLLFILNYYLFYEDIQQDKIFNKKLNCRSMRLYPTAYESGLEKKVCSHFCLL